MTSDGRKNVEKQRLVEELHAPARRNFPRRHVIVRGYDDLWQADIVEMRPYSRFNKGYHYILTVIDVLSKYAWAVPLKSKGGSETAEVIAKIIRESGRCPKNLQTDMGKEFYNTDVQRLVRKHNINHYSTYSVLKASVVERFNRTLKNNMWKMFTFNGTYKWIDELPRLVADYNARKHRTIGMRPLDVTPAIAKRLLTTVYSAIKIAGLTKFKVGDRVRVSKHKTVFEKGYTPNWSTEVFKIVKVQHTNPATYLLEDYRGKSIAGAFYEHELHHAAYPDTYLVEKVLRRRGDEVYVKWLGFDGSHNSWIHKDNVI
jgi:transposase InsO family protein